MIKTHLLKKSYAKPTVTDLAGHTSFKGCGCDSAHYFAIAFAIINIAVVCFVISIMVLFMYLCMYH